MRSTGSPTGSRPSSTGSAAWRPGSSSPSSSFSLSRTRCVQNPLRQYLGRGQFFANDMGQLSHAAVFMIGCAYAWRWDRQVRMDLLYRNMVPRARAVVNLLGTAFLLLPWLVFVTLDAVPTVIDAARNLEGFPESGSPGFFVMKSLLLAFAATVGLLALAVIARSIAVIADPARARP